MLAAGSKLLNPDGTVNIALSNLVSAEQARPTMHVTTPFDPSAQPGPDWTLIASASIGGLIMLGLALALIMARRRARH